MITFTEAAAERIKKVLVDENDPTVLGLRVFVSGGGCSGFQYGFTLESNQEDDDYVTETSGIKLFVDPMSYQYLTGAKVDYVSDIMGEQFVITNPNVTTTCGCGSSFTV